MFETCRWLFSFHPTISSVTLNAVNFNNTQYIYINKNLLWEWWLESPVNMILCGNLRTSCDSYIHKNISTASYLPPFLLPTFPTRVSCFVKFNNLHHPPTHTASPSTARWQHVCAGHINIFIIKLSFFFPTSIPGRHLKHLTDYSPSVCTLLLPMIRS